MVLGNSNWGYWLGELRALS